MQNRGCGFSMFQRDNYQVSLNWWFIFDYYLFRFNQPLFWQFALHSYEKQGLIRPEQVIVQHAFAHLFIEPACPDGMERKYGRNDPDCQPTCWNPNPQPGVGLCPDRNSTELTEDCFCKEGFVWNGEECVNQGQCDCYFMGYYYKVTHKCL